MPRKSGREVGGEPVEGSGEVPGEVQVSDQQVEMYERIQFLKEKFGDDATGRASIQRRLKDGRLIGLPSIPALTFDTDLVAKRYGGGRYYVRFYQGRQYLGDIEFELDESLQPEPEPIAPPVPVGGSGEAPSWLAASLGKMGDAIAALASRPAPAAPVLPTPPDPMAMIEKLATTMRALTPPPAAVPAPVPAPSFTEQLEVATKLVNLGKSIVGEDGGGGGSGDAYMGVVERLATPVIDLMKTQVQRQQLRKAPAPRPALPAPTGPVPDQPVASAPAGGTPQMPWLLEVQKWMPLIVKRQQKGLSAESTAFFVLDELSEPTLTSLAQFFTQDDADAQIQMILPAELRNDPAWTGEFLTAVRDYLFEEDEEDDASPTKTFDLEAEAERRLAKLRDKPKEEQEPQPEQ